ncbi:protein kinase [Streptomyces sp. NPDC047085]|uniref:serine/threonine-protein kinase n=1 Tax=Streptomyces sp. NPDC047085 TaxID=3155140 RepID=UPI00340F54FF
MGEVFAGRYELADPIGRGGVGAVWRAWDHRRRRYVAAKVLQQRDAHALLRFVREQALRIDHPHVLAPASWAADDDQVLFTMDLVAGGSLVHLVNDYGPLPPSFVCTLLDQLLSGLAAVHAEGVVHRDIKPANVLLEATGTGRPRLRLSDFGIAMRLGEVRLTETNLVVGTPGYLAPEQMLGAEPDFPADLFAVGLVALYLLEGAKPDAKALMQYFMEHGTPGPPQGIPEPLWQVVATLLQPDPAARFRTATGARKALAAATELLPEPGPDQEPIEIFDQLGSLPPGFGPEGPLKRASGVHASLITDTGGRTGGGTEPGTGEASRPAPPTPSMSDTGSFHLPPPQPELTPQPESPALPESAPMPESPSLPEMTQADHTPQHQAARPQAPQHHQGNTEQVSPAPAAAGPAPHISAHTTPTPWHPAAPHTPPAPQHTPTAAYTAQDPQAPQAMPQAPPPVPLHVPPQPHSLQPHSPQLRPPQADPAQPYPPQPPSASRRRGRRARRKNRRPGPSAKVAIPILLLALACYGVGFWALTRV